MNISLEVLRIELLQLARDKRALFSAIVLPALLYPVLFLGMSKLEDVGAKTMEERSVTVLVDLSGLNEATREAFIDGFSALGPSTIETIDASVVHEAEEGEERRLVARAVLGLDGGRAPSEAALRESDPSGDDPFQGDPVDDDAIADLLVIATQDDGVPGLERATFVLWYDVKSDDAREGRSRARETLEDIEAGLVIERRERLLGGDPAAGLDVEPQDIATIEDTSGALLGKILPFITLLVLLSGGAYAALAVFAGEREAGTLETLLVQPVPRRSIATGKFLAVFVAGTATLLANLASLVGCVMAGITNMDAFGGAAGGLSMGRLSALLVELPACLLLCALLCLVCGGAKTFREGQLLVFPVTLLVLLPTAIVLRPDAELTAFWAMIPFSGSALALRDGLEGDLTIPLAMLVVGSHLAWTWLALTRLAGVLDAEKILSGDSKAESHLQQASATHAVRWGFAVVMTVYLIAMSVQRWDLDVGLWFTFWCLLPALAFAIAWTVPRQRGEPRDFLGALGLRLPRVAHVLGALLIAPALTKAAEVLFTWQQKVLPLPKGSADDALGLEAMFNDASTLWLFFFFAFSPGLIEELVFRGSLLSAMRKDWRWPRILAWQALYFALVHASIYRLLPTGILGALLAAIALRSRSVIPAMVLHATYNGLLVLGTAGRLDFVNADWYVYAPWAAVPGVLLLALPSKRRGSTAGT